MQHKQIIAQFTREVLLKYGGSVQAIMLFGSAARGEATEESDIDILVVWNGDKIEGWNALEGIAYKILLETRDYISLKVLTPDEFNLMKSKKTPFISNVLKNGVAIA